MGLSEEDRAYDLLEGIISWVGVALTFIGAMAFQLLVVAVAAPKIFTVPVMLIVGVAFVALGLLVYMFSSKVSLALARYLTRGEHE